MLTLTNILAGLSLILALACGGLWGRSYWVPDGLSTTRVDGRVSGVRSAGGRRFLYSVTLDKGRGWSTDVVRRFSYTDFEGKEGSVVIIMFPHWSLLLALLVFPALRGWHLLRSARRRSENLCPQCGYDLRATPQRCPECGHETPVGARVVLE